MNAAQHLRRCPMCAAVGWVSAQSDEPTGDLRDRLAHAMAHAPGTVYQACNDDMYLRIADAVLPVVEAALAQQAAEIDEDIIKPERALHEQTIQRAEQAERERDAYRQRFANQMTAATELTTTLREAERKLQQALEAIADERRGRLAAEAAVRRVRALADDAEMTADLIDPDGERIQYAAVAVRDLRAALDAEQPKETR